MQEVDNFNWRCFLALEQDLINTENFVEFHKANYKTYSIKYRSIIMQACSEIEIILKKICGISPDDKTKSMEDYAKFITSSHKDFYNVEILIPSHNEKIKPWPSLSKPPNFWTAYNNIKHQGKLEDATLENSINALAGLLSLLLAWYIESNGSDFSRNESIKLPNLFAYPGLGADHLILESSHHIKIPGF